MKTFNVLVVDDDKDVCEMFRRMPAKPQYKVLVAESVPEAKKLIDRNFLHIAILDMQLTASFPQGGLLLANLLAKERPSCHVYLLTQHPDAYKNQLFALLDPVWPKIHGAISKTNLARSYGDVIDKLAAAWFHGAVEVTGADIVLNQLVANRVRGEEVDLTEDELDHVVSCILGQGRRVRVGSDPESEWGAAFNIAKIKLELLTGGRSSSAVALGQPMTASDHPGIWCVMKFSPRDDAVEEYERYCRYVRYLVSLNYRVELLSFEKGDTIGAMCYSFAGRSPAHVTSLDALFREESARAFQVLNTLFAADARFWYGLEGKRIEIGEFLGRAYWFVTEQVLEQVQTVFEKVAQEVPDHHISQKELVVPGGRILGPERILGQGFVRQLFRTTVIHGDMNANNVIVSDDDRVILIDYRHTTYGPRSLDFAALECSARLAALSDRTDLASITASHKEEEDVWKWVWRERPPLPEGQAEMPYWRRVSIALGRHARSNFSNGESLQEGEYAITCLLWALRVFRVRGLTLPQRYRLLIWMSHLTHLLGKLQTRPAVTGDGAS